jgi:hypothetical protein
VLLLDEIEKAHPDIFNILLQVMDRGMLTDTNGREANFRTWCVVMTTNAGAQQRRGAPSAFVEQNHSTDAMETIRKSFTPEFRNRLDAVMQFKGLDFDHILRVVDKFLIELEMQLHEKQVALSVEPEARRWLAEHGFDPQMGARPMARVLQENDQAAPCGRTAVRQAGERRAGAGVGARRDNSLSTRRKNPRCCCRQPWNKRVMTSLQRRLMNPHSVGGAHGAGALRAVAMLLMLGFGIEGVAAERDTAGATFPAGESAAKVPQAQAIHGGTLLLRPNPDLLAHLGLRAHGLPERGEWNLPLWPREPVTVELGDGAPTRLRSGKLSVPSLRFVRRDGARSPHLSLVPDGIGPLNWRLVDAQGGIWMRIAHAMRSPDRQRDGLRLVTADLRVGPALSAWTRPEAEGRLLANAALQLPLMPLSASDEKAAEKSCVAPNWPGVGNYVVDVELIDMDDKYTASVGVDVQRCRVIADGGPCDGPGGTEGEVVIVPSAVLRSRNVPEAADVPWHTKFSGVFAPYGNDQHPFLVWAMYRIDADGRIDQIGRSGLKHAFATANENCHPDAQCPANGQVLGRACEDTYNAGSNDQSFFLSPRTEIIPARGIWGPLRIGVRRCRQQPRRWPGWV